MGWAPPKSTEAPVGLVACGQAVGSVRAGLWHGEPEASACHQPLLSWPGSLFPSPGSAASVQPFATSRAGVPFKWG